MSIEERLRGLEQFNKFLLNVMDVYPNGVRFKQATTILDHAAVTLDANADAILGLTGQVVTVDKQRASFALIAPVSAPPEGDYPVFRKLVADDLPERWYYFTTPMTSTAWDGGDAFSTTAKTLIDLSAVFGVPAGVKAVLIKSQVADSGSASGIAYLNLSPNNTAGTAPHANKVSGMANSYTNHVSAIVPCNANGDIYYQIGATGSGTMSVLLEIWGYYI